MMLGIAIGVFVIAVMILVIDMFIEGFGVLGVVGILGILASLIIHIVAVPFGVFVVAGKVILMVPAAFLFVRFLRKRQLDGRFVLTDTLAEDVVDLSGLEFFMGKEGITKTALRPFGRADFNGSAVEVWSEGDYVPVGKNVKVVEVKDKKIFVRLNGN